MWSRTWTRWSPLDTETDWRNLIMGPTQQSAGEIVIRPSKGGIRGNWSTSFCVGFLSINTPEVGAKLAGMLEARPPFPWRLFFYCSWLSSFKSTFLNDLIISKKSSSMSGISETLKSGDFSFVRGWRLF